VGIDAIKEGSGDLSPVHEEARSPMAARKTSAKTATVKKSSAKKRSTQKNSAKKSSPKKKGGARKYSPATSEVVREEMEEFKEGKLRSGRSGKKVTDRKQAVAIALSEARRDGKKVPPNPNRGSKKKS
jgi:hypothetical protein